MCEWDGCIREPLQPAEEKHSSRKRSVFPETVLYKPCHCLCPKREGHLQHPDSAKPHAGKHVKSLTQSCQRHYYVNPSLNTLVLPLCALAPTPEYQKPIVCLDNVAVGGLAGQRHAASVHRVTFFFTHFLSVCDRHQIFTPREVLMCPGYFAAGEPFTPRACGLFSRRTPDCGRLAQVLLSACAVAGFTACTASGFLKTSQKSALCVGGGGERGGSLCPKFSEALREPSPAIPITHWEQQCAETWRTHSQWGDHTTELLCQCKQSQT